MEPDRANTSDMERGIYSAETLPPNESLNPANRVPSHSHSWPSLLFVTSATWIPLDYPEIPG